MRKPLRLNSLETYGENINKCMVYTVFSSATLLQYKLFYTWTTHIGKMANRNVIRVWTQQGLPGQSPPCGVTQGYDIFEARTMLYSHQVEITHHTINYSVVKMQIVEIFG